MLLGMLSLYRMPHMAEKDTTATHQRGLRTARFHRRCPLVWANKRMRQIRDLMQINSDMHEAKYLLMMNSA